MTTDGRSILQATKEHRLVVSVIRNEMAVWLLGYIELYSPVTRSELEGSLDTENPTDLFTSIDHLGGAGLIQKRDDGKLETTELGARLSRLLGVVKEDILDFSRRVISCDVFQLENVDLSAMRANKVSLIEELVHSPHLYGEREGSRYGFVESKVIGEEVVFGYFAQEYWDRSLKYDNGLERREEWDTRYTDLMFVWPLHSSVFILQDTRFYGAPTLNMTTAKNRILMILTLLLDHCNVRRTGDVVFRPFQRTMSKEEMLAVFEESETVSRAQIGLEAVTYPVEQEISVFNPREDWNEMLREIINVYEIPNVGNVVFTAKKLGTLSKSKIAKALALVGELKTITLGRGKGARKVTPRVPTHIARVNVNDPVTEEEVIGIVGYLQERIGVRLTDLPVRRGVADLQIKLDI